MNRILLPILLICVAGNLPAQDKHDAKTKPKHTNRLAKESSPYLLQHAHNPVNWYPWGDEAFEAARRENKMIFLSVGYAACHWCHVMERESFVDPEIAKIMNEKFICVKVDREERPDVDQIYMTAVQMVSGNGGWPMSVFLLPDTRPFWGGTYFPARTGDRAGATGFLTVLNEIDRTWRLKRNEVEAQAKSLTQLIKENQSTETDSKIELGKSTVDRVASSLNDQFDPEYGGFGYSAAQPQRPKFPEPANLVFLLDRMQRESVSPENRKLAKDMLIKSLDGMISGAMVDHFGGGFHRYSVDRRWQIPHFEKMLYDNGQLVSVFSRVSKATNREEYRRVVIGACDFVLRELAAPGGAFYSALDADSEGEEGKFYRWTSEEIESARSNIPGFDLAAEVYGFDQTANFEREYFAPDPRGTLTAIAKHRERTFSDLDDELRETRKKLFDIRSKRERPITDVKILTAWNGLMIAGFADAGRLLEIPKYTQSAIKAADFIHTKLQSEGGRLKRSFAANKAKLNGYADDYAFFASGLIALHRATDDDKWLTQAKQTMDKQIELFWDDKQGGFFFTSKDHPALIVRAKDPVDGALPSAISVSLENLAYLHKRFPDGGYLQRQKQTFESLGPLFQRAPAAVPRAAAALADYLDSNPSK